MIQVVSETFRNNKFWYNGIDIHDDMSSSSDEILLIGVKQSLILVNR